MKLSFMTFACPDWTVTEIIEGAQCYGFDGVEIRVAGEHRHGLEADTPADVRRTALHKFQDAGVDVPCVATSLRYARWGAAGQQQREETLPLLELAADLGARGLRVFGGEPVRETEGDGDGVAREDAIKWAADNIRAITGEAEAHGVGIWFETHDYFRLGRDAAAVIRMVDHPMVRCNWDVMHPQCNGEDFEETKGYLTGLIEHTHFHDTMNANPTTICEFGTGVLPLLDMLKWLRAEGFKGYLSAEYFGNSMGEGPDVSLPLWANGCRDLLKQLEASE